MRSFFRRLKKAPLAIAALIAFPIFLASLMAVSLAIDSPVAVQWRSAGGRLIEVDHPPASGTEAKIWALALALPGILLLGGLAAVLWRGGGIYVVCAMGLTASLLLPMRLDRWVAHHSKRFPFGMDLVPDSSTSNLLSRGEWEDNARHTVLSLTHWTIGLVLATSLITAALTLRRRLGPMRPVPPPPPEVATGEPVVAPRSTLRRWF